MKTRCTGEKKIVTHKRGEGYTHIIELFETPFHNGKKHSHRKQTRAPHGDLTNGWWGVQESFFFVCLFVCFLLDSFTEDD